MGRSRAKRLAYPESLTGRVLHPARVDLRRRTGVILQIFWQPVEEAV